MYEIFNIAGKMRGWKKTF